MAKLRGRDLANFRTVTDALKNGEIDTIDGIVDAILVDTGTTIPGTISTAQADLDVLTGATGANLLTATQASIDAIEADTAAMGWRCVEKTDGAVLTGDDDLFDITGGPVRAQIVGLVTTVIGGAANGDLQIDVTEPAATIDLNAAPVAIDADAAGTIYMCLDSTSVFTPVTAGAVIVDTVDAPEAHFILPVGTVIFRSSAAQTGVIAWFMQYQPLSPNSVVTAAT